MRAWRSYVVGAALLDERLHRELQDKHGVSLADYTVLVVLSEEPDHRMRMSQLADKVASSKSRVSHQIARMEAAGLVRRVNYPGDGRGVLAELTEQGQRRLAEAAPTHVAGVRTHLIDLLSDTEQTTLASIFGRIIEHLQSNGR